MMMSVEQVKEANKLVERIESVERLITAYRKADEVIVGIPAAKGALGFIGQNQTTLAAAEDRGPYRCRA